MPLDSELNSMTIYGRPWFMEQLFFQLQKANIDISKKTQKLLEVDCNQETLSERGVIFSTNFACVSGIVCLN